MGVKMGDTCCGNCGHLIYNEDSHNRKPCPNCGSTTRRYSLTASISVAVSATATATKIAFPQSLLISASNLIQNGDDLSLSMAVILSHTACDIAADRAFTAALEGSSIPKAKDPLRALISGYSPKNDHFWNLFSALTGDAIKQEAFWQHIVESSKCRDGIVHRAEFADAQQAEKTYSAATDFVKYLKQWD
ncbi:MAG: hypothetical protein ACTSV9_01695 [Candidatus Thorarchaeota archaeon]